MTLLIRHLTSIAILSSIVRLVSFSLYRPFLSSQLELLSPITRWQQGWQPGPRRDWLHCPLHNISHDTNIVPQMEITWKHKNKLKSWQRSWGVHYSILIRAVFCLGSNVYGIATTAWGGIKSLVFNKIFNNLGLGENFAFEGLVQIMR